MAQQTVKEALDCCLAKAYAEEYLYKKNLLYNKNLSAKITNLEYLLVVYNYITEDLKKDFVEKVNNLCNCCNDIKQDNTMWVAYVYSCEVIP